MLLKSFIANVQKCKPHFKTKLECMHVIMSSLAMSLLLCHYIKMEIDQLKYDTS